MVKLLAIAAGGALGALARYAVTVAVQRPEARMPWGTLTVNALGCLAIGFLATVLAGREVGEATRALIFIGLLGAFTTFSTYGLETLQLASAGGFRAAALNLVLANATGLAGVWLGARLAGVWPAAA